MLQILNDIPFDWRLRMALMTWAAGLEDVGELMACARQPESDLPASHGGHPLGQVLAHRRTAGADAFPPVDWARPLP
jgi:hypothetical protein